jgi:hypothetical protein
MSKTYPTTFVSAACSAVVTALLLLNPYPALADDAPAVKVATPTRQTDKSEFVIGPDYADAPETKVQPGVPKARSMSSR